MAQKTLSDAIAQVVRNMSLTNGVNMTPYSQDTVASYLIAAHEHILAEHEWQEMIVIRDRVLDGTTGFITQLIADTDDWKNIRRIYHESSMVPLPMLSTYINTLSSTLGWGYRGLPPEEDNNTPAGKYLVAFYPPTLTGRVRFDIRRSIDFAADPDTVILPVDWWLHVYIASWMYANDDGTNPMQIQKYQQLMSTRMKQVCAKENSRHTSLQPNQMIPNDWWETDAPYS